MKLHQKNKQQKSIHSKLITSLWILNMILIIAIVYYLTGYPKAYKPSQHQI